MPSTKKNCDGIPNFGRRELLLSALAPEGPVSTLPGAAFFPLDPVRRRET